MYSFLLVTHSILRWFVFFGLIYNILTSWYGSKNNLPFTKLNYHARHIVATFCHCQLAVGIILYTKSPIVSYFLNNPLESLSSFETVFYGVIHFLLMLIAVIMVTIGSSLAKRKPTDKEKFKTILFWYSSAIVIILIAIPWPFSPLSARPLLRF